MNCKSIARKGSFFLTGVFSHQSGFSTADPAHRRGRALLQCSFRPAPALLLVGQGAKDLGDAGGISGGCEDELSPLRTTQAEEASRAFLHPTVRALQSANRGLGWGASVSPSSTTLPARARTRITPARRTRTLFRRKPSSTASSSARRLTRMANGFILLLHIGSGPGRGINSTPASANCSTISRAKVTNSSAWMNCWNPKANHEAHHRRHPVSLTSARARKFSSAPAKWAMRRRTRKLQSLFKIVIAGEVHGGRWCRAKFVSPEKPLPITGTSWGQFTNHAELDFSALTNGGRYTLRVGDAKSFPFAIGAVATHFRDCCWNSCNNSGAGSIRG